LRARVDTFNECQTVVANIAASTRTGIRPNYSLSLVQKCITFCNDLLRVQVDVEAMHNWLDFLRGYKAAMSPGPSTSSGGQSSAQRASNSGGLEEQPEIHVPDQLRTWLEERGPSGKLMRLTLEQCRELVDFLE